jgi:hypothetical protein
LRQKRYHQRAAGSVIELTTLMTSLALSPVIIFLRFHGYRSILGELALILLVASAAAMVAMATRHRPLIRAALVASLTTWFVDLGFDVDLPVPGIGPMKLVAAVFVGSVYLLWRHPAITARLGSVMAITVLGTSLLTPPDSNVTEAGQARRATSGRLLIHIILDEHLGIAGLQSQPADLDVASEVRGTFERSGFRVFGGAYSQEMWTLKSISRLFNPTTGSNAVAATTGPFEYELTTNEYFDRLVRDGYALHVLQSVYFNFCPSSVAAVCHSLDHRKLGTEEFERLPVARRIEIMGALFAAQSETWARGSRLLGISLGPTAGVELSPMGAIDTLDRLAARVSRATAGEAYFAHVGAPHAPYAYDRECRIRPIAEWLGRTDDTLLRPRINTAAGRLVRYKLYIDQVRCVGRRVEQIVAAVPADLARDAVIIVQGDHGSRITEHNPDQPLSHISDFVDVYSTLFAVRAPGIRPGYQPDQVSLSCIFQGLLSVGFSRSPELSRCSPSEPVYSEAAHSVGTMPRFVDAND